MSEIELKSAEEWLQEPEFKGIIILDPDGWDRRPGHFEKSWNKKITKQEFNKRLMYCTISGYFPGLNKL